MTTTPKLRIHIAPLGFEVDRIVLPAIKLRADVVCLLVHSNRSADKAEPFEHQIRERLEEARIEVRREFADRQSLFGMLRAVRGIITGDVGRNNDIYVNVSSGSKIQSIACMMACMMWNDLANLMPYYAEPEEYASSPGRVSGRDEGEEEGGGEEEEGGESGGAATGGSGNVTEAGKPVQISSGLKQITDLPKYRIQIPRQDLIGALAIVRDSEGGRIKKSEMAERAEELGIIKINSREENKESARFASLAKNIIDPLTNDWKFIHTEKVGRTRWVSLTEEGKNASEFLL